jgi:porin
MRAALFFSALFFGASLVEAADEAQPNAANCSVSKAGDLKPSPAAKNSFVPSHTQIGTDGLERSIPVDLSIALSPTQGIAKPAPGLPLLLSRPDNLFGTWFDLLPALQHDGINPSLVLVSDLAGNPIGGKRHGFTEADDLGFDVRFDLDRLCGLPGAKADLSMSNRSGSSLTDVYVNNVFEVQEVVGGSTIRFVNLYFEQSLVNDRFNLRVGRLGAGDEFLTSPLYTLFMQNGINGNPAGILFNAPGFTVYPVATWAARFRYRPVEEVYVMTGLYDGNPNIDLNEMHGLDFTLHGPLFWITEVGYQRNSRKGATGLPGNYKAGIWYNDGSFSEFAPNPLLLARRLRFEGGLPTFGPSTWGDWGFYLLADQMLWRAGGSGNKQSLTVFGAFEVAPEYRINAAPYFVDAGVVWHRPFPSRPLDYAGFEFGCGTASPDLNTAQRIEQNANPSIPVQTYEMILEWTYGIHVAPGVLVQPDLQYIVNPGAAGQYPNAFVIGMQVSINF